MRRPRENRMKSSSRRRSKKKCKNKSYRGKKSVKLLSWRPSLTRRGRSNKKLRLSSKLNVSRWSSNRRWLRPRPPKSLRKRLRLRPNSKWRI